MFGCDAQKYFMRRLHSADQILISVCKLDTAHYVKKKEKKNDKQI